MSETDGSWIPFFENITIDGNGVWIYEKKITNGLNTKGMVNNHPFFVSYDTNILN